MECIIDFNNDNTVILFLVAPTLSLIGFTLMYFTVLITFWSVGQSVCQLISRLHLFVTSGRFFYYPHKPASNSEDDLVFLCQSNPKRGLLFSLWIVSHAYVWQCPKDICDFDHMHRTNQIFISAIMADFHNSGGVTN